MSVGVCHVLGVQRRADVQFSGGAVFTHHLQTQSWSSILLLSSVDDQTQRTALRKQLLFIRSRQLIDHPPLHLVFDGARAVMQVISSHQQLQHGTLPQQRDVVPLLGLLGPVAELSADQLNEFRVTERQEVNDLVDPPQKLVPSEMSLQDGADHLLFEGAGDGDLLALLNILCRNRSRSSNASSF